jgi:signal transduction histidine kinase
MSRGADRPCGAGETDGWVGVEVSDTGLGIPTGEQERVFEEFHRIHPAQAQGTGLGLAISRRLARLLGGDLTLVRSEVGRDPPLPSGSRTIFRPPRSTRAATERYRPCRPPEPPAR